MEPQQPIQPMYSPAPTQTSGGGFTRKQKIVMLSVGVFAILGILLILVTAIFGGKQSANEVSLTIVNARNNGILVLLDTFESDLRTAEGVSYVSRAKIFITSDSLLLAGYSPSPSAKQVSDLNFLALTDELTKASTQSDFDKFFISSINYEIEANKTLLEKLDPADVSSTLEPIVSTAITNYESLLN